MRLESFKAGELQQVSDIADGKPVLLGAWHLHPDPFGKGNERFPKVVVSCYQHARVPLAKRPQISQRLKHIYGIADIVEENVVEFLVQIESLLELLLVWKGDREFKGWVSLLCDIHDLIADLDTFPTTRPDNGQEVASAAANR